jgi:hypothetical protein
MNADDQQAVQKSMFQAPCPILSPNRAFLLTDMNPVPCSDPDDQGTPLICPQQSPLDLERLKSSASVIPATATEPYTVSQWRRHASKRPFLHLTT